MSERTERLASVAAELPEAALSFVSDMALSTARNIRMLRTRLAQAATTDEQLRQAVSAVSAVPQTTSVPSADDFMAPAREWNDDGAPTHPMG